MSRFASSKIALGMCDVCGFQYKLRELRSLTVKGRDTNVKACSECWNPDQPQLRLGDYPVDDPQAIRNPRTDTSLGESGNFSSRVIQWSWNPVGGGKDPYSLTPDDLIATGYIGQVIVTTT
tara:strand:- start:775 stop:1137 length:363 start_codon:yes stop_codon:yes gene_type:complete